MRDDAPANLSGAVTLKGEMLTHGLRVLDRFLRRHIPTIFRKGTR